jgi:hypothetical protein
MGDRYIQNPETGKMEGSESGGGGGGGGGAPADAVSLDDMTLFHGTSSENAASIRNEGFDPSTVGTNAGAQGDGIYVTASEEMAMPYTGYAQDNPPLQVAVTGAALMPENKTLATMGETAQEIFGPNGSKSVDDWRAAVTEAARSAGYNGLVQNASTSKSEYVIFDAASVTLVK